MKLLQPHEVRYFANNSPKVRGFDHATIWTCKLEYYRWQVDWVHTDEEPPAVMVIPIERAEGVDPPLIPYQRDQEPYVTEL